MGTYFELVEKENIYGNTQNLCRNIKLIVTIQIKVSFCHCLYFNVYPLRNYVYYEIVDCYFRFLKFFSILKPVNRSQNFRRFRRG